MGGPEDDAAPVRAPCYDSGDLLRWVYNCFSYLRKRNKSLADDTDTYIIGCGTYNGKRTTIWATEMMGRLLYFSYRNRFVPLMNGATTDTLWGCMIRTGQMMLAHVFMRFFNGGDPVFHADDVQRLRRRVQVLFFDLPSSPFGIHAVTTEGVRNGVRCGKWFGPTPLAKTLTQLCVRYVETVGSGPVVLFIPDREVNGLQVTKLLQESRHVVLLIPAILGMAVISESYGKLLAHCLEMESSIGILGGCRSSALFLCGHQSGNVFHLDPHFVQRAFVSSDDEETLKSAAWRMLPATQYDPSMALGFYIASSEGFAVFEREMVRANSGLTFPLISVTSAAHEALGARRDTECVLTPF